MRTRRPPAAPAARSHASRGRATPAATAAGVRHGLARVLSKAGVCSRSEAARWIAEGRVRVSGRIVRDPEFPIGQPAPPIEVDGQPMGAPQRLYLMLNKPRGVVTTAQDERGRDTVYRCFDGAGLPWIAPVGRLDKASEGLLLFSNDPQWAARLTDPETGPQKTYHVQVDRLPDDATLAALQAGVEDEGEFLVAQAVRVLRSGDKTAWLEVVLDEGRNRHIRRLLAAFDLQVLRLVRVAIGGLQLGDLGKGQWRMLEVNDQQRLGAAAPG
ncbi:rRNA pseudouridine synthase [Stenotrophomonas maltophilia]|nr:MULTISPECIES: pseudouridine synthase [Stenotrophomonas]MBA0443810.1 rRNA pseudouridine synthase [Stenotrophomonas maltophilia]MBH1524919.1 rRNA pseudouridine synthase [Stenotrophomonas maltophilia]MBH1562624.1 rRNA pseudouridine synthase [Stenotrophomonas maltophilia]MBH1597597.1 rRNA pseudouridine synthase [Stenotrophomonas maltophilia]MBH1621180.1 rRNA pseudouridine synthase [Stenotrophomonas maltophilia]